MEPSCSQVHEISARLGRSSKACSSGRTWPRGVPAAPRRRRRTALHPPPSITPPPTDTPAAPAAAPAPRRARPSTTALLATSAGSAGSAGPAAAAQGEGWLQRIREALGDTGGDPGHWNLSPQWWGTQGGGWGRDEGRVVFAADSRYGNGRVTVTSHECSTPLPSAAEAGSNSTTAGGRRGGGGPRRCEWRVLRFNDATRQSVALVELPPPGTSVRAAMAANDGIGSGGAAVAAAAAGEQRASGAADGQQLPRAMPTCLAFPYLKTMASLAEALHRLTTGVGGSGANPSSNSSSNNNSGTSGGGGGGEASGAWSYRVLCIGVGGGGLPLFLAHLHPDWLVEGVEIDPAVVAAATQAMGLPTDMPNLRIHTADACDFVASAAAASQQQQGAAAAGYDLVVIDAFDGSDAVPAPLCSPGAPFLSDLAAALHPARGAAMINLHGGSSGVGGAGYVPASDLGRKVDATAALLRGAVLQGTGGEDGVGSSSSTTSSSTSNGDGDGGVSGGGAAFTVSTAKQDNIIAVAARGVRFPRGGVMGGGAAGAAAEALQRAAADGAGAAGFPFPAGSRASRGLQLLP